MRKKSGFTLIELLVVIAIIALLLSIVVPSLRMAKEHTQRTICGTNLRSIGTAIVLYSQSNNDFLPPSFFDENSTPTRSYMAYLIDRDRPFGDHITNGPYNFAHLYESKLIETPEVFYCPSAPRQLDGPEGSGAVSYHYDGYHNDSFPWPWNTQDDNPHNLHYVRVGYNYVPQSSRGTDSQGFPKIAQISSQMHSGLTMSTDLLYSLNHIPHTRGVRGGGRGINALFSDGSVRFCNNQEAFDPALWMPSPGNDNRNFRKILRLLR